MTTPGWNSTSALPQRVESNVKNLTKTCILAAVKLQRWFRSGLTKDGVPMNMPRINPSVLKGYMSVKDYTNYFLESPAYGYVKIDGTNIRVGTDGSLCGRNNAIDPTAQVYQKTSLTEARTVNAAAVVDEIVKRAGIDSMKVQSGVIYGELMCNSERYDYKTGKLKDHTFLAFAARLVCGDDAEEVAMKVAKANFTVCNAEGTVIVYMCPALEDVLAACNVPVVPRAPGGTLADIIERNQDWMEKGNGEGIVITLPCQWTATTGCFTFSTYKWKIGREVQVDSASRLPHLHEDMKKCIAVHPRIDELFNIMTSVVKSKKIMGVENAQHAGKSMVADVMAKEAAKAAKAAQHAAVDPKDLEAAYESACTKFDHVDVYIAAGKLNVFVKEVANEIISSGDLAKYEEKVKSLGSVVTPFVGRMAGTAARAAKKA